jgi:biotin operon repressor
MTTGMRSDPTVVCNWVKTLWIIEQHDEANPVSVKQIRQELGLSDSFVRKIVRDLVGEGHPIASDHRGYWMMQSKKEMQAYFNRMLQIQVALTKRIADTYRGIMAGESKEVQQ